MSRGNSYVLVQGQVRDWWVVFLVSMSDASVVVKATARHTTKSYWLWFLLETMSRKDMWCSR
jgi:hypothetical protein